MAPGTCASTTRFVSMFMFIISAAEKFVALPGHTSGVLVFAGGREIRFAHPSGGFVFFTRLFSLKGSGVIGAERGSLGNLRPWDGLS
jgi:hypothetical protein